MGCKTVTDPATDFQSLAYRNQCLVSSHLSFKDAIFRFPLLKGDDLLLFFVSNKFNLRIDQDHIFG